MADWSRLPSQWIHNEDLRLFQAGKYLGKSVAALKVLLAVALCAENNSADKAGRNQGSAGLSYDELMSLTDLSRPMVAAGVKLLCGSGIVAVEGEGQGRKNRYFLSGYGVGEPWGKLPNKRLYRNARTDRIMALHEFSCRRVSDLNALKLYLLLTAFRDVRKNYAMIGYEKIWDYTGIPEAKIRRAISVLIEQGMIRVDQEKGTADKRNHPNRYEILGL
jgi:predicted transcriptional regulator